MAANNLSLYFKLDPTVINKQETMDKLKNMGTLSLGTLAGEPTVTTLGNNGDRLFVFISEDQSHAILRLYSHGLLTLDIQHYVEIKGQIKMAYIRTLLLKLEDSLGDMCLEADSLYAPIRRGQDVWPYAITADERLLEHDYDKMVYRKESRWQDVRIYHSLQNGNVLFLDGDSMLGESDIIYTQTLCRIGQESYQDKNILILGGGDGGILHELLKEKPKHILMAEIDEEVIYACRTHMRSVCGSDMDDLEGPNYKIHIGDCVAVLHKHIQSGELFDYVINDLTEFPVDKAVNGFTYDFETTSRVTELSLKAVKPGGKLLARGNCVGADEYQEKFESDVTKMGAKFVRREVYVPSFREIYCLYEIWRPAESDTGDM